MLTAVREVQIPLLAVMLLGGCAAKAWRVVRARSVAAALGPTGLFPLRLQRPIMVMMCAAEFGVGIGLVATAGEFGAGVPASVIRMAAAVFFLIAVGALYEVRQRRPDSGCGCFGELSETPIGLRTIGRCVLLCVSAIATLRLPPRGSPPNPEN